MAAQKRKSGLLRRTLIALLVFVLLIGAGDFLLFSNRVGEPQTQPTPERADAVVVLTGGAGRIPAGLELVADGAAERILISGVNPDTTIEQLKAEQGGPSAIYDCCTDLGVWATSTITNAKEAAAWSEAMGVRRLILVTSDYHMPRAMIEFRHTMPGFEIVPWPVITPSNRAEAGLRRLAREWLKFRMAWFLRGGAGA